MRVVVDDLRTLPQGDVHLRTSWDAVDFLIRLSSGADEPSLEALYLDHDLGEDSEGIKDTIMPVVDYLCEQAWEGLAVDIGTVYVHTMNPVGRENIIRSLERYGYECVRMPLPEIS